MQKKLELGEKQVEVATPLGTFFGSIFLSHALADAIDGPPRTEYTLKVGEGPEQSFKTREARDEAARNSI